MDSIIRFASGLSNTENFARDVYIKSNLTIELDRVIKQIQQENPSSRAESSNSENRICLIETPTVSLLCDILEAIFLHGIKEKLSTRVSNVFSVHSSQKQQQHKNGFYLDFWPIVTILCHASETRHLTSISTDIGRCRAWLRSTLNESLFRSYFDTLICDSSTLNGFYRSSAYIRDTQHTEMLRRLMIDLEAYIFNLSIDNVDLNCWSDHSLHFLGVNVSTSNDDSLVVTALDAIHLISEDKLLREDKSSRSPTVHNSSSDFERDLAEKEDEDVQEEVKEDIVLKVEELNGENTSREALSENHSLNFEVDVELSSSSAHEDESSLEAEKENTSSLNCTGNSLSANSLGWSTQPAVSESYDAILESYSSRAILSSTPDIHDVRISIAANPLANATNLFPGGNSSSSFSSDNDFEIIPKSVVLNTSDAENKRFLEQLSRLANEKSLPEQDYKCALCFRPIGMIYGKCRLCHVDGSLYCTECHIEDEAVIPAQIIYNWSFRKCSVSRHNKKRLQTIETEPIFDILLLSPLLYSVIPEMADVLDLRTQLFFLHAYLFTCQEGVALKMRKMVWPREHLFEHIHLYSVNDLLQVYNNSLAPLLRQTIAFARSHVFNCALCKLKGYYCEICKGSQILYPFDTDSTKRCENCKSVFHIKCFDEKYDRTNCPKCLRLAKKQKSQQSII